MGYARVIMVTQIKTESVCNAIVVEVPPPNVLAAISGTDSVASLTGTTITALMVCTGTDSSAQPTRIPLLAIQGTHGMVSAAPNPSLLNVPAVSTGTDRPVHI
jgi:hypothetical protein